VARLDGVAERLADVFWPGPLTLVLPVSRDVDDAITAGSGTVAIRVPGSDIARQLALAAGGALVSTSANLSGGPPPVGPGDLHPDLLARIDAVLEAPPCPGGLPSTIVLVDADAVTLVRAGAVPWEDVLAALRG
jgi:L-threonylcarbamoyladenylate synthase